MYLFGNGHQYCKSPLGNGRHVYVTKYHVIDLELYLLASVHYTYQQLLHLHCIQSGLLAKATELSLAQGVDLVHSSRLPPK